MCLLKVCTGPQGNNLVMHLRTQSLGILVNWVILMGLYLQSQFCFYFRELSTYSANFHE